MMDDLGILAFSTAGSGAVFAVAWCGSCIVEPFRAVTFANFTDVQKQKEHVRFF